MMLSTHPVSRIDSDPVGELDAPPTPPDSPFVASAASTTLCGVCRGGALPDHIEAGVERKVAQIDELAAALTAALADVAA